jgi:hypothetical protein
VYLLKKRRNPFARVPKNTDPIIVKRRVKRQLAHVDANGNHGVIENSLFFRKRKRREKKKRMQAPETSLWYPCYAGSSDMCGQSHN